MNPFRITRDNNSFTVKEIHPGYFLFLSRDYNPIPVYVLYVLTTKNVEEDVLQLTGYVGTITDNGVIRWGHLQEFCAFSLMGWRTAVSNKDVDYWIVRHPTREQKTLLEAQKIDLQTD